MNLEAIKEVRERSGGAGMNQCKSALEESNGDIEKALEIIATESKIIVESKKDKAASEGLVYSYTHANGKIAVIVEINCQTDFVARCEGFKAFCELVALQIAGMNPRYVSDADIPIHHIEKQKELFQAQILEQNPHAVPDKQTKILIGKLEKWKKESCLLDQESFVQPGKTINKIREELIGKLGENIKIRRFVRVELGDGMEKVEKENFADEIAKLTGIAQAPTYATKYGGPSRFQR